MQDKWFLLITLSLVCAIGAPAMYSALSEPKTVVMTEGSSKPPSIETEKERAPASVSPEHNRIKAKSLTLDYDCKASADVKEVEASLLRLKGNTCLNEHWKNVSIVNKTNGYTAAVILLKNKGFTTDFMDLADGENKLAIEGVDDKGQSVQQVLRIKKRLPASEISALTDK